MNTTTENIAYISLHVPSMKLVFSAVLTFDGKEYIKKHKIGSCRQDVFCFCFVFLPTVQLNPGSKERERESKKKNINRKKGELGYFSL